MKRIQSLLFIFFLLFSLGLLSTSVQSCSRGYGCETEEYSKRDINEQLTKAKRGDSNLFPKRMRKKMNK